MEIALLLNVGDKLELQVREGATKGEPLVISQVADIRGNKIFISGAFKEGAPYPLNVGQRLNIIFYKEEKGVFHFPAEVISRMNHDVLIYEILPLGEMIRIQRRDFYRFDTTLKIEVQENQESEVIPGVTKDISGGGVKFYAPKAFSPETLLEMKLYFDDGDFVFVKGNVVRCDYEKERKEYVVRVSFCDVREAVRGRIISYIFDKQRSLRKKGLI